MHCAGTLLLKPPAQPDGKTTPNTPGIYPGRQTFQTQGFRRPTNGGPKRQRQPVEEIMPGAQASTTWARRLAADGASIPRSSPIV
jgi:hypothetical protein